jgi:DNA processing protein
MPDIFSHVSSPRRSDSGGHPLTPRKVVSPFEEMLAYEVLWSARNQSLKTLSNLFKTHRVLPSDLLEENGPSNLQQSCEAVRNFLAQKRGFSVSVHGDFQYPNRLQQAKYPVELFYYKGDIDLLDSRCISLVGARKATVEGKRRAKRLARELVKHDFTIVSGLALGIDTVALTSAISAGGRVVGVIGTPIDEYYPRANIDLQNTIAQRFLLLSQVPFFRYAHEPFTSKRHYFPQRNETMSALSEATVIVEASDTSGTLTQARACLEQGRKLFILESCFHNPAITWPTRFEARGAIRVRRTDDILSALKEA